MGARAHLSGEVAIAQKISTLQMGAQILAEQIGPKKGLHFCLYDMRLTQPRVE